MKTKKCIILMDSNIYLYVNRTQFVYINYKREGCFTNYYF